MEIKVSQQFAPRRKKVRNKLPAVANRVSILRFMVSKLLQQFDQPVNITKHFFRALPGRILGANQRMLPIKRFDLRILFA